MSSSVEAHVLARIAAAPVIEDPFPHCIVDGVFPADFYEDLIDRWPEDACFVPLVETGRTGPLYSPARHVVQLTEQDLARLDQAGRAFWECEVAAWLMHPEFLEAVLGKFHVPAVSRVRGDALIVSDRESFAILPHTDAIHRLATLLFYLPEDAAFRRYGTSLYAPLDASFRSFEGLHHPRERFRLAKTAEFLPNRLLMFPKSDRCFHGVEPVDLPGIERRSLIFNVRRT